MMISTATAGTGIDELLEGQRDQHRLDTRQRTEFHTNGFDRDTTMFMQQVG